MALVGTESTVVVHGLLSPAGIHGHRPFPMGAQVHGKNPRFTSPRSTVHGHGLLGPIREQERWRSACSYMSALATLAEYNFVIKLL